MHSRWYTAAVIIFWLASTLWLVTAKIVPALNRGQPPEYDQEFAVANKQPPQAVGWELFWNRRPVGFVVSQAFGTRDEPEEIRSLVRFEKIGLKDVLGDLLGGFSFLSGSLLGVGNVPLNLTVATKLQLDWNSDLHAFQTSVRADDRIDLLLIRGNRTDDDHLKLAIFTDETAEPVSLGPLAGDLPLPEKAQFSEAFSPRSRMKGLHVGQKWTTPVIVPLAGANTVRLVESRVATREEITWRDRTFTAFLLEYRQSGDGGQARDEVSGLAWVDDEGLVVRQELKIGSATVRLERMDEPQGREHAFLLGTMAFDRFLHRRLQSRSAADEATSASSATSESAAPRTGDPARD